MDEGFGLDLGVNDGFTIPSHFLYSETDKTALIYDLAAMNSYYGNSTIDTLYEDALAVANNPYSTETDVAEQVKKLESAIDYKVKNGVYPSEKAVIAGYGETFSADFAPGETPVVLAVGNKAFLTLPDKVKKTTYSEKGIVTVNAAGQVTPKKAGQKPVKAEIELKNGSKVIYWFIVEQPKFEKKPTISVGETVNISKYITGLTYTAPDYFIASNPDKLYVDPDGSLTAVKKGSASIQVFVGAKKYTMSFKVVEGAVPNPIR